MISFEDFKKVELKVAEIKTAERVIGSDKLIRLQVDAGDRTDTGDIRERQILAGIGLAYEPESLVGRQIVIVANLEPKSLMGLESQGMLLAASDDSPILLAPEKTAKPGAEIR